MDPSCCSCALRLNQQILLLGHCSLCANGHWGEVPEKSEKDSLALSSCFSADSFCFVESLPGEALCLGYPVLLVVSHVGI